MPIVGMVGAGQLARMTHQAAIGLGQSLRVLALDRDDSAAMVTADVQFGSPQDLSVLERFADACDVLTFDHEQVPIAHIRALQAIGHAVHPGADAVQYAQDKVLMRRRLAASGVPVPTFDVLRTGEGAADAMTAFGGANGWPMVFKTATGGYDGHGVWVLDTPTAGAALLAGLPGGTELLMERFVPMRRELAALVARSPFGQAAAWPVVQTVQQGGICATVIAPAPGLADSVAAAASRLALSIAADLSVVGVMAVELFEVEPGPLAPDGLLVNELAMRPHNSGHWTMDGSITGQFEQHLRAILDYPLGRTDATAPFTVMGNVLGGPADPGSAVVVGLDERVHHLAARFPQVKMHLYGKAFRPGRKLGHVSVSGDDPGELERIVHLAADWLGRGEWTDGYRVHGPAAGPMGVDQ